MGLTFSYGVERWVASSKNWDSKYLFEILICNFIQPVSHWIHKLGGNVVGLGMNEYELSQNKQIHDYVVRDLNVDPTFPFEDESFDKVTCVVSVDYLTKPKEIFDEIGRVLRPGGQCILSISNRWYVLFLFLSMEIYLFSQPMSDLSKLKLSNKGLEPLDENQ